MGIKAWLFLFLLMPVFGSANEISFPDSELPSESLPPMLDSPEAVMSRAIEFERKWEPRIGYGWLLDEAFYKNSFTSLGVSYSWRDSALTVRALSWGTGLSDYAKQFSQTSSSLQFERSHGPESGYSLAYEDRFLYGKVSFAKSLVIPTTVAAVYEFGMIKYGSRPLPFGGAGVLSSWYFTKSMGFHLGLNLYLRQALDPTSQDLRAASPEASESSFSTTTKMSTALGLGFQFLF